MVAEVAVVAVVVAELLVAKELEEAVLTELTTEDVSSLAVLAEPVGESAATSDTTRDRMT